MAAPRSPFDLSEPLSAVTPKSLTVPARRLSDLANTALEEALAQFSARHGLSNVRAAIVADAMRGMSPDETRRRLNISLGTYKAHVRKLVHQCGVRTLEQARVALARLLFGVRGALLNE